MITGEGTGEHDGLMIAVALAGVVVGEPLPYVEHPDYYPAGCRAAGADGFGVTPSGKGRAAW